MCLLNRWLRSPNLQITLVRAVGTPSTLATHVLGGLNLLMEHPAAIAAKAAVVTVLKAAAKCEK